MEGPSLLIASEELSPFIGKKIIKVEGNTKIGKERMFKEVVVDIFSWGKHLVFQFDDFAFRVHFLMFGSYRAKINGVHKEGDYKKPEYMIPRLALTFENGEVKMYNCSVKFIEEKNAKKLYDELANIMSEKWDTEKALEKVLQKPNENIIDVLMDQTIFAGVGNIIKNEVLHRQKIHPEKIISDLAKKDLNDLIKDTYVYSHLFYEWRKKFELKKHWQVYRQKFCKVCGTKVMKKKMGKLQRMTHFCEVCQLS